MRGICSTFIQEEDRCARAVSPRSRSSASSASTRRARSSTSFAGATTSRRRPSTSGARAKYAGVNVSEAKRLRALEEENRRLKQLLADAMLDNQALKGLLAKNW